MPRRNKTFVVCEDGGRHELVYRVRLLVDHYVEAGEPGEVEDHAGEVIIMGADDAVRTLASGYGKLVGEIIDGVATRESV